MKNNIKKIIQLIFNNYIILKFKMTKNASITIGENSSISPKCRINMESYSKLEIGDNVCIEEFTRITVHSNSRLIIGNNVYVSFNSLISSNSVVRIGDDTQIAHLVSIIDTNHNFNDKNLNINKQGGISKPIVIGRDVWIATGVTVLADVKIDNHSIIAAHAVVNKDVPANVVAGGIPCKIIKER